MVREAVYKHGNSHMEVARHLRLHYSTVRRLIKSGPPKSKGKDLTPMHLFSEVSLSHLGGFKRVSMASFSTA
jgi:hypothetical protein